MIHDFKANILSSLYRHWVLNLVMLCQLKSLRYLLLKHLWCCWRSTVPATVRCCANYCSASRVNLLPRHFLRLARSLPEGSVLNFILDEIGRSCGFWFPGSPRSSKLPVDRITLPITQRHIHLLPEELKTKCP